MQPVERTLTFSRRNFQPEKMHNNCTLNRNHNLAMPGPDSSILDGVS